MTAAHCYHVLINRPSSLELTAILRLCLERDSLFANKVTIVCCPCLQSAWAMEESIARPSSDAVLTIIHAPTSTARENGACAAARSGMDS